MKIKLLVTSESSAVQALDLIEDNQLSSVFNIGMEVISCISRRETDAYIVIWEPLLVM